MIETWYQAQRYFFGNWSSVFGKFSTEEEAREQLHNYYGELLDEHPERFRVTLLVLNEYHVWP